MYTTMCIKTMHAYDIPHKYIMTSKQFTPKVPKIIDTTEFRIWKMIDWIIPLPMLVYLELLM